MQFGSLIKSRERYLVIQTRPIAHLLEPPSTPYSSDHPQDLAMQIVKTISLDHGKLHHHVNLILSQRSHCRDQLRWCLCDADHGAFGTV
jgi:hypothetical protein